MREQLVSKARRGPRVLVVDDDPHVADLLDSVLRVAGFEVITANRGIDALARVADFSPEVVVLDVSMPDKGGFEVCEHMRSNGIRTPVLFLSGNDDMQTKVKGLTIGADDYMTKPFHVEEVVARLRALLRRTAETRADVLVYEDLKMDMSAMRVERAGKEVNLTRTEFEVLHYLLLNAETVVSKPQILDHVWQYEWNKDANLVETYVSQLRKKVDTVEPKLIHTVRSYGYVIRAT